MDVYIPTVIQTLFALVSFASLIYGFFLGSRYKPEDSSTPWFIFIVGLVACLAATIFLAQQGAYILGIGQLMGGFFMGISMGMHSTPRE